MARDGRSRFYSDYIKSAAWKERRRRALVRARYRCQFVGLDDTGAELPRCPRTRYLCVHHVSYERLGAEWDGDLEVLCWTHHMLEHLLQRRCTTCTTPVLEHEGVAERWLAVVLTCRGVDLDREGPEAWFSLPTKETLMQELPASCPFCERTRSGGPDAPPGSLPCES